MVTPNRRHLIKDEFFAKEYPDLMIPIHEQDKYHVIMESRVFHRTQGNKLSKSKVQSFAPNMWDFMVNKSQYFSGYTTFIVHDPTLENIPTESQSKSTKSGKGSDQTDSFQLIEVDRVGKVTIGKLKKAGIETVEELSELSGYSEEEILPLAQAAGIELAQLYEYAANAKELIEKG